MSADKPRRCRECGRKSVLNSEGACKHCSKLPAALGVSLGPEAPAESLIYTIDSKFIDVNTKDMDSTLSRASRAIKKTSKKITKVFSSSKIPKRAPQRALLGHSTPEGSSLSSSSGSRMTSASSLAITRSNSTFSINGPARQHSNSLDGSSSSPRSQSTQCLSSPKKLSPNSQLLSTPPTVCHCCFWTYGGKRAEH